MSRLDSAGSKDKKKTDGGDPVDPVKCGLVEFLWLVIEGRMTAIAPQMELDVGKVVVHKLV